MENRIKSELEIFINQYKVVKLEEKETIGKGFIKIKTFDCLLNNGTIIKREQILRAGGDGDIATIVPITKSKKLLMVAQPRAFIPLTIGFEFPAGYVESGEDPMISAGRELLEETGYSFEAIEPLITYQGDPGCSRAVNHCFVASGCQQTNNQNLDESEYIKQFECTLDDAIEMQKQGLLVGSSSIVSLQLVKERRGTYGI